MNNTLSGVSAAYVPWQQALLPLLGGVVCPLLSWLAYRLSRQRLKRKETLQDGAHVFYRILSGVLLSQFLCHTVLPSSSSSGFAAGEVWPLKYMAYFIVVGYFVVDTCEAISRIWNTNENHIAPLDSCVSDDIPLNRETMEEQSTVLAKNIGSPEYAQGYWRNLDQITYKRKTQWMLGLLLVVFCIITVMDGMLLVFKNPQGDLQMIGLLISFFINGISMSFGVYGGMIHAKFHVTEERGPRIAWWIFVTVVWSIALICCTIPVLIQLPIATAQDIINNRVLLAFYGIAGGCVLKLQQYYHEHKINNIDRKQTIVGIVVFFVALAQGVATSLWL
ncbi:MAG: hypothetical protein K2Q45_03110 [Nitrosomonas sp.]|nr:hypothetical protein [Nitrosomonas sp.]